MVTDSGFVPYLRQETPVHDALAATYAEAAAECAAHEGWRLCTRAELALTDDRDDPAYCVGTACSANERCSKYKGYKQSRRDACFSQLVWSSDVCTEEDVEPPSPPPSSPPSPPPPSPPPPPSRRRRRRRRRRRVPISRASRTCQTARRRNRAPT